MALIDLAQISAEGHHDIPAALRYTQELDQLTARQRSAHF